MINSVRTVLYAILLALLILSWQHWQQDFPAENNNTSKELISYSEAEVEMPSISTSPSDNPALNNSEQIVNTQNRFISIKTDVIELVIDKFGGNIVKLSLNDYKKDLKNEDGNVILFQNTKDKIYIAQSGMQTAFKNSANKQITYESDFEHYELQNGQEELLVRIYNNENKITQEKIFKFTKGSYLIEVNHQVENNSSEIWRGRLYAQIKRSKEEKSSGFLSFATYTGGAISSPDKKFEKITFDQMSKGNLDKQVKNGWIAMLQHYFVSAWIPEKEKNFHFYSNQLDGNVYRIGMVGNWQELLPQEKLINKAKLYAGPEITSKLAEVAEGLELTVDYGWFWPISQALFWLMKNFFDIFGNWAVAIVLVTLVIKLLFFKLSASGYSSMAKMRKLQPNIMSLKEKYGDDRQKMSQEMMALYKKEKVNPLGGCLPILIQIPVFIALYWVLIESVELRHAPFMLWIEDLSSYDPFYVLPLLMGATMLLQQRLSPTPPDPMQAKMMMAMPIVFTVLFLNFPSGLMLYWIVNNSLSILQQWIITKQIESSDKRR